MISLIDPLLRRGLEIGKRVEVVRFRSHADLCAIAHAAVLGLREMSACRVFADRLVEAAVEGREAKKMPGLSSRPAPRKALTAKTRGDLIGCPVAQVQLDPFIGQAHPELGEGGGIATAVLGEDEGEREGKATRRLG